jgi:hypothetical protein
MIKKPKDTIVKKLVIKESYKNFGLFYNENKTIIYKSIVNLFNSLKRRDKQNLVLILSAKINGLQWETELKFNRKESFVLVRDILPYFEDNEDYEFCSEINTLYEKIQTVQVVD